MIRTLFPTKSGRVIFVSYMILFVGQGMLVTAARRGKDSYPFETTSVVLLTELLKLIISMAICFTRWSLTCFIRQVLQHVRVLGYYIIPAALYCVYNNLAFINLARFDPTTYFVFMQIRLLMTGIVYQVIFKQPLSRKQWVSLMLLTLGCMIQAIRTDHLRQQLMGHSVSGIVSGLVCIVLQVSCSVVAGVYNEYLIKGLAKDVDILMHNVFMYIDSIACNMVACALIVPIRETAERQDDSDVLSLWQGYVPLIVLNNALAGIITSFFLKSLNSIVKAFASALELIATAVLSSLLFQVPLYWNTVLAVLLVSWSVIMYAQNPVPSFSPSPHSESDKPLCAEDSI